MKAKTVREKGNKYQNKKRTPLTKETLISFRLIGDKSHPEAYNYIRTYRFLTNHFVEAIQIQF